MGTYSVDLLEVLAGKAGCMYLSDLKRPEMKIHIAHQLYQINASDFSLKEWKDAVQYLASETGVFHTEEQAKQYLMGLYEGRCPNS